MLEREIREVSKEEGRKLVFDWTEDKPIDPIGFIFSSGGSYIGIDNSTNDCWVEEFSSKEECLKWLRGEIEVV